MKYVTLDYDTAHAVVEQNRFLSWDGYDIVTRRKSPNGFSDKRGRFVNNEWWIEFRYPLRNDGSWKVPDIYAKN